jgi:hypothetical protein
LELTMPEKVRVEEAVWESVPREGFKIEERA